MQAALDSSGATGDSFRRKNESTADPRALILAETNSRTIFEPLVRKLTATPRFIFS